MMRVTKTYGHDRGYSSCFRQHRAASHCRHIHGYALAFTLVFECPCDEVNECGWVIDFGGLKPVKAFLDEHFDHKFLAAADDPHLELFRSMHDPEEIPYLGERILDLVVLDDGVGCENFAKFVYQEVESMLLAGTLGKTNARLVSVEVREHGSNGATYVG